MSRLENQHRLFLDLVEVLRPRWRRDPGLPGTIQAWLSARRAGSRDRRLYRELAFTTLRILPVVESLPPTELVGRVAAHAERTPATAEFIDAYADQRPPASPDQLLPSWLTQENPALAASPAQRDCLLSRAPLWLRLQTDDPAVVAAEFTELGWTWSESPALPGAWRLDGDCNVLGTRAFRNGLIEIQDIGSQALLAAVDPVAGTRWLDACAGAGGKTLQLARLLGSSGHVTAHDVRPAALAELKRRAERAGITHVSVDPRPGGSYDGVLVDAPCTGSGTWRRSPHLKWTTTEATMARAAETQAKLLARFAPLTAPGGLLVYATCSLCQSENEAVVSGFANAHPAYAPVSLTGIGNLPARSPIGLSIWPADLDSDAYFVAAFRRES